MIRTHSTKADDGNSELLVRHVECMLKEEVERVCWCMSNDSRPFIK